MKKRIAYIDICKTIGIVAMIMGHIGFGKLFDIFIHLFHMPLFFFITGFLYKDEYSMKNYLVKKFRTLIIPYFSFSVFHIIISILLGETEKNSISPFLFFYTNRIPIAGALWFLMSLFVACICFGFINRISNWIIKTALVSLITLTGHLYRTICSFYLPFGLGPSMVGIGFMYLGNLLRKKETSICYLKKERLLLLVAIPLVAVLLFDSRIYANMRTEEYPDLFVFWFLSLICIIVCLNISRELASSIKRKKILKTFTYIGENSIIYVVLNQIIIRFINSLLKPFFTSKLIVHVLCLVFSIVILSILSYIFKKTKLKVFLGLI